MHSIRVYIVNTHLNPKSFLALYRWSLIIPINLANYINSLNNNNLFFIVSILGDYIIANTDIVFSNKIID